MKKTTPKILENPKYQSIVEGTKHKVVAGLGHLLSAQAELATFMSFSPALKTDELREVRTWLAESVTVMCKLHDLMSALERKMLQENPVSGEK